MSNLAIIWELNTEVDQAWATQISMQPLESTIVVPCCPSTEYCTLYDVHSTLYTLHFTIYTHHFTLYTLHQPLNTHHFTLYTLHSTLYTLYSTLCTSYSTLYTLYSTLYTLYSTLLSHSILLSCRIDCVLLNYQFNLL